VLIIGAKGHAREILDILEKQNKAEEIYFYDDISIDIPYFLFNKYPIIRNSEDINNIKDKEFLLGIGNPHLRKIMAEKFKSLGWKLVSVISDSSIISNNEVILGDGLNIMNNVFISCEVRIGEGALINQRASIHHNSVIGNYCEISPGACITGNVQIGNFTSIGAGAIIIPRVIIGDNCVIGAGSVVTKNIPDNSVAVGVPAKVIKEVEPFNE